MTFPTHSPRSCAALIVLIALAGCRRASFPVYPDGYREFAYVANSASNTVTVLDLVYLRADRTLLVGSAPVALAVNPVRDEVYVVNQAGNSVSVISSAENRVVASIPVERAPSAIAVERSGHRAFVVNTGSNTVTLLDLDSRRALKSIAAGERPSAAAVSPDGRSLVVTNQGGNSVSVYDLAPQAAPAKVPASDRVTLRETITGCPGATAPVILPGSSKVFVACSASRQVMVLSLAAEAGSWPARQDASLLADHLVALLDVGQHPTWLTLKPDGGEIFASNSSSDTVSEISTQTNEVGSTYPIGNHPAHGVVSADNSALWVSNAGADSISLYSIDDGKLVSSIRTGVGPDALAFSADEHLLLVADARSGDVALIRTNSKLGPALFTLLPAGANPSAIVVKGMQAKP